MKKTLLITLEYPPQYGGIASYLHGAVKHLDSDRTIVLAPRVRNNYLFDQTQSYRIHRAKLLSDRGPIRWLRSFFVARSIIRRENIEHVIISHLLPMGYVAVLLGIPFTVLTHGMDVELAFRSPRKRLLAYHILRRAAHIIANSEFTKSRLVSYGIPHQRIVVMYPCLEREIPPPRVHNAGFIVLTAARLVERKGIDASLHAIARLISRFPQIIYHIAGEGPDRVRLEKIANELQISDHVVFHGAVSEETLEKLYTNADVFLMPAREIGGDVEGFGMVFLEANAHGVPVIGGASGGVPEAINDGESGLLVNPTSVTEIQDALERILGDPSFAARVGAGGRARVEREFGWEKQIEVLRNILYT